MGERNVLHVRATSAGRFSFRFRLRGIGATIEEEGLSAAEVAEAIRALPLSYEIRFLNEGRAPVNLIAAANAALQRSRAPRAGTP